MNIDNLKALLSRGYFPENLPKVFDSGSFGEAYDSFKDILDKNFSTTPYKYDAPKKGFSSRQFSIIHPYNFSLLLKLTLQHWAEIDPTLQSSKLSYTSVKFKDDTARALFQVKKSTFQERVFRKSVGMRTLLITDISDHYPSTYTHALAWAMHGKDQVKQLLQNRDPAFKNLAGNILDKALRDGNEQQTNGIPVGPETSRIVSEIILSAADAEIQEGLESASISYEGGRYVDDYQIYFPNSTSALQALEIIRGVLSKYDFRVGEQKTRFLSDPPMLLEEEWVRTLRPYIPIQIQQAESSYSVDESEVKFVHIKRLLNEAVALTKKEDDTRIIRYVVSNILRRYRCNDDDWDLYEIFLLQILSVYPATAKSVFDIFQNHEQFSSGNLAILLNRLLASSRLTVFEAIWFLYGCIVLNIIVAEDAIQNIVNLDDPILWLMLLHLNREGQAEIEEEKFIKKWREYDLEGFGWLYKYEAVKHGWISDENSEVMSDPFFEKLYQNDVSFYLTDRESTQLDADDWSDIYDIFNTDIGIDHYDA